MCTVFRFATICLVFAYNFSARNSYGDDIADLQPNKPLGRDSESSNKSDPKENKGKALGKGIKLNLLPELAVKRKY